MGIAICCDLPAAMEPRQRRLVMATKRMLVQYWRLDRAILKLTSLFEPRPYFGSCCETVGTEPKISGEVFDKAKSSKLGRKQRVYAPARCDSVIAQVL